MTQNFAGTDSKYFDIYRDKKYILSYNLIFKKFQVGLNSFNPSSRQKNNIFQFYKDENHTENFEGTDFKLFNIYRNKIHILSTRDC